MFYYFDLTKKTNCRFEDYFKRIITEFEIPKENGYFYFSNSCEFKRACSIDESIDFLKYEGKNAYFLYNGTICYLFINDLFDTDLFFCKEKKMFFDKIHYPIHLDVEILINNYKIGFFVVNPLGFYDRNKEVEFFSENYMQLDSEFSEVGFGNPKLKYNEAPRFKIKDIENYKIETYRECEFYFTSLFSQIQFDNLERCSKFNNNLYSILNSSEHKLLGLNDTINFGIYREEIISIKDLIETNPDYLEWLLLNIKPFVIDPEILIKNKSITKRINLINLRKWDLFIKWHPEIEIVEVGNNKSDDDDFHQSNEDGLNWGYYDSDADMDQQSQEFWG